MEQNKTADESGLAVLEDVQVECREIWSIGSLIPEDEREVVPVSDSECAREQGFFSGTYGMASIKIGDRTQLKAKIIVDETGARSIEYCQLYRNGTLSATSRFPQAKLLLAANPKSSEFPAMKRKVSQFIADFTEDYLGKFAGDELIEPRTIICALLSSLPDLPVYDKVKTGISPAELYDMVMDVIKGRNGHVPMVPFCSEHRAYFAITDSEIEYIAKEIEMKPSKLIEELAAGNLLYLTASSRKFKTNVRYDKENTDWAYCLIKLDYFRKVN